MNALISLDPSVQMPTKLKRISVALDDEAYARLEELALSSKRSVANMVAVLIDAALFPGGRILAPREEKRGGKRPNAGRKPKPSDTEADRSSDTDATKNG